jgi:phenylacetate-coenzyme A ligase PaaK-like adenylate-forming protein
MILRARLDALLAAPPFASPPEQHETELLSILRSQLAYAAERSPSFRRYINAWPCDFRDSKRVADLPYLPVGAFKADPSLALVPPGEIVRTLKSSATTGQTPSRVVLDAETSRRLVKGVISILRDFIGSKRRPLLVIDSNESLGEGSELGARGAAIQGLRTFATETVCCLRGAAEAVEVDSTRLEDFAVRHADEEVLVYGFTYVVWQHLVRPLQARGLELRLPNAMVLHSGGWKRLQDQAVTREEFAAGVSGLFGCPRERVIDFYGMVENVGVVYPDCAYGNKHIPAFANVVIRDPLTLESLSSGRQGLVQVCSILPSSFPGFLVLTDDIGEVVCNDSCPCGRRGIGFRFVKRVPKVEMRGCGNVETKRQRGAEATGSRG